MQIFFPVIGCHFKLKSNANIKLLTNKNNAKFLDYLKLLPGCLPVSAWERNLNIQTIEVSLEKDSMLTINKIKGIHPDTEVHFSYYVGGKPGGKKYNFVMLLKDINNTFEVYY
jgi:hypothetical protein